MFCFQEFTWDDDSAAAALCNDVILTPPSGSIIEKCIEMQGEEFLQEAVWQCSEDIQVKLPYFTQYTIVYKVRYNRSSENILFFF